MEKTIKKQRLFFIALIGIVVISLSLMTTFAFQTLSVEVKKNSSENLNVKAGVLDVSFSVSRRINLNNIPLLNDYRLSNYTEFTVDNANSSEDVKYMIRLIDVDCSEGLKNEDFKYTIVKVIDDVEYEIGSGDFSKLNSNEFNFETNFGEYLSIKKEEKQVIRIYLWLKESDSNQNNLKNAHFKGLLEINSYFAKDITVKTVADFKIYGVSKYDDNLKQFSFLGGLVNDDAINKDKYKIDIVSKEEDNEQLEYSLYLNNPLRCVNSVCDYIDLVNNKIVRYIAEYKLSSSDDWILEDNIYKLNIGFNTSDAMSTHFKYSNTNLENNFYIDNNTINIMYSDTNLNNFKKYLDDNEVIIYYVLKNPIYESISSINLSRFIDKDILVKSDNNIVTDININYE